MNLEGLVPNAPLKIVAAADRSQLQRTAAVIRKTAVKPLTSTVAATIEVNGITIPTTGSVQHSIGLDPILRAVQVRRTENQLLEGLWYNNRIQLLENFYQSEELISENWNNEEVAMVVMNSEETASVVAFGTIIPNEFTCGETCFRVVVLEQMLHDDKVVHGSAGRNSTGFRRVLLGSRDGISNMFNTRRNAFIESCIDVTELSNIESSLDPTLLEEEKALIMQSVIRDMTEKAEGLVVTPAQGTTFQCIFPGDLIIAYNGNKMIGDVITDYNQVVKASYWKNMESTDVHPDARRAIRWLKKETADPRPKVTSIYEVNNEFNAERRLALLNACNCSWIPRTESLKTTRVMDIEVVNKRRTANLDWGSHGTVLRVWWTDGETYGFVSTTSGRKIPWRETMRAHPGIKFFIIESLESDSKNKETRKEFQVIRIYDVTSLNSLVLKEQQEEIVTVAPPTVIYWKVEQTDSDEWTPIIHVVGMDPVLYEPLKTREAAAAVASVAAKKAASDYLNPLVIGS